MVARVKQTESHIIENPVTVGQHTPIKVIKNLQEQHNIQTILIAEKDHNDN